MTQMTPVPYQNKSKVNPVKRQSTLNAPAVCAGVALHSGQHVRLVMKPAPAGTGVVFVRTDITDRDNRIFVRTDAVTKVHNCTTISNAAGVTAATIEHLMAALCASGIDNVRVEIDGPELPALDGSAEPFFQLIEQVGLVVQPAQRRYVKALRAVELSLGDSFGRIEPSDRLKLDVTIDFEDAAIGRQSLYFEPDVRSFRDRLASARTFARVHEVDALLKAGLSKGGSLDNAVIVDGDKVLNPGGLRYADEFVRHKALDLMGDLYVAGPLLAKVTTERGGHALNHALLTKFMADPEAWTFETLPTPEALLHEAQTLARA
ncbi:UDP-3-O-acyl-N-acetylglucosamine deacetylase [Fretibacter rubidus]|uniref:UDP-3-O-acyl-N-acetylglucosamine deacetylase n=1 Tax=Fretibacter rubidus TaxID=570162 RepID=UPI00352AC1B1